MDYESLDPGIRDVVRKLRANGFETTDSGDGISKPAGERVMDFPHVACSVARDFLFSEADRLQSLLGEEWLVEATYIPSQQSSIILATKPSLSSLSPGVETPELLASLATTQAEAFKAGRASMLADLNANPALVVAKFHQVFDAVAEANKLMVEVGKIVDDMAKAIPDNPNPRKGA